MDTSDLMNAILRMAKIKLLLLALREDEFGQEQI